MAVFDLSILWEGTSSDSELVSLIDPVSSANWYLTVFFFSIYASFARVITFSSPIFSATIDFVGVLRPPF